MGFPTSATILQPSKVKFWLKGIRPFDRLCNPRFT